MTKCQIQKKFCKFIGLFTVIVCVFSLIYSVLGLYEGNGILNGKDSAIGFEYLYFSFVTITTLGYGDFLPQGYSRGVASIQSVVGLVYFGVGIANIVSIKQDALLDYLKASHDIGRLKSCIYDVVSAKEDLADHRRVVENTSDYDELIYTLNKGNPFYDVLQSLQQLEGYVKHLHNTGSIDELKEYIDRAAHHTEESIGVIRKTLLSLEEKEVNWKVKRTKGILTKICLLVERYTDDYLKYSTYDKSPHKGGDYKAVISGNISKIRANI